MNAYVLKGDIFYSTGRRDCQWYEGGYLVCTDGVCKGAFQKLPEEYRGLPLRDYGHRLIIPGLVDLHLHAPQYPFRGLGMDMELMQWLDTHTFPEEARYRDLEYAERAYSQFAEVMRRGCTTRAVVFATAHTEPTWLLMDKLEETGLCTFVGRVNMDANTPDFLREKSAEASLSETVRWLDHMKSYRRTRPILTPRFVPSCSGELMEGLGVLARERGLGVQSHLSESFGEITFVRELFPREGFYGEVYDRFGLLEAPGGCIMAHCVHSSGEEAELLKKRGVFIAHSPESNINLCSGVAPVSRYLDQGLSVGLATDVAAGSSANMFRSMAYAVQASKLLWRLKDESIAPLSFREAFYLATLGGGGFFGKVGTFLEGYAMDALVLDDSGISTTLELSVPERVERLAYLYEDGCLTEKLADGQMVYRKAP